MVLESMQKGAILDDIEHPNQDQRKKCKVVLFLRRRRISYLSLITSQVLAQTPVSSLQDLVEARGSSGEIKLEKRGYQFLKTEKSGSVVCSLTSAKSLF